MLRFIQTTTGTKMALFEQSYNTIRLWERHPQIPESELTPAQAAMQKLGACVFVRCDYCHQAMRWPPADAAVAGTIEIPARRIMPPCVRTLRPGRRPQPKPAPSKILAYCSLDCRKGIRKAHHLP